MKRRDRSLDTQGTTTNWQTVKGAQRIALGSCAFGIIEKTSSRKFMWMPIQVGTTTQKVKRKFWHRILAESYDAEMVDKSKLWIEGKKLYQSHVVISFSLPCHSNIGNSCQCVLSGVHVAPTFRHDANKYSDVKRTTSQLRKWDQLRSTWRQHWYTCKAKVTWVKLNRAIEKVGGKDKDRKLNMKRE